MQYLMFRYQILLGTDNVYTNVVDVFAVHPWYYTCIEIATKKENGTCK